MTYRVLVLTDDAADATILIDVLGRAEDGPFTVEWVRRLAHALENLRNNRCDAILADLSLPDSDGLATFDQLSMAAPHTPIMTLTGRGDEALARQAVQRGSQGYLARGNLANSLVSQALSSMIQRKTIEQLLYLERSRAETTLKSIADAVVCTDTAAAVVYLNPAAEKLTGWSKDDATGRPIGEVVRLVNRVSREPERSPIELALMNDRPMPLPPGTIMLRRNGSEAAIEDSASPIRDWSGKTTGAVMVFRDVTANEVMTAKLIHQTQHDTLTDLPNRALLQDRTMQAIAQAKRHKTQVAMLFIDLDNFKDVNDTLGHPIGDRLLQSLAKGLTDCVRKSDTVSRQGGDEFVILLTGGAYDRDAASIAGKILAATARTQVIDGKDLSVTASIGISVFPVDGEDSETLIKRADAAMYHAKEKGGNNFQFFTEEMNARAVERRQIEAALRCALELGEFRLHYQPKVDLVTGAIRGAEALLRWRHPEWGLVPPVRFIPVAEASGLIVPIGQWVLGEACTQAKRWIDAGLAFGSIAVNISALELRQDGFVEGLRAALDGAGVEGRYLQLEITESVLMEDAEANGAILRQIKSIGVQLAVDDFGTGYSSLSYLTKFPIDVLKIDQSFVSNIELSPHSGIIAGAVIDMGNSLNLRVVAEGIENRAQLAFLRKRHCKQGQGFLFSEAIAAEEFAALLSSGVPMMAA